MQGMARVLCYVYSYNHEAVETVKHLCISEIVIWLTIASSLWYSAMAVMSICSSGRDLSSGGCVSSYGESPISIHTVIFPKVTVSCDCASFLMTRSYVSGVSYTFQTRIVSTTFCQASGGICSGFFVSLSWKPLALQQLPQQLEPVYLYAMNWEWCAIHRDFLVNTAYLGGVLEYWKLR